MRHPSTDIRSRAALLLLGALGCAAYIIYRNMNGQTALLAWLPLMLFAFGAIHYFRRSRS